jgi:hypothetical protein
VRACLEFIKLTLFTEPGTLCHYEKLGEDLIKEKEEEYFITIAWPRFKGNLENTWLMA